MLYTVASWLLSSSEKGLIHDLYEYSNGYARRDDAEVPEFDKADTAFMLVCASLVMLMTPGLAFFYGGLVSRSSTLTIMMHSFISLALTDVIWFIYGYSLSFSETAGGIIGNINHCFLIGLDSTTRTPAAPTIPELVFMVYQMMFAIITPALITGAFANRVRFRPYILFLVLWLTFVYVPWAHWVWGGGFLMTWGVKDFAGGIVVHATAGMAALASVLFVGPREERVLEPHSIPLVALGSGLLWFGWYGFNAGSRLAVDGITALAFFNTDISASTAAVTWMIIEWFMAKKPKFLGLLTGSIAGLATITPAAGFVPTWAAFLIGIFAGAACYLAVWIKNKLKWDDALDVWGVHGVGGILGTILLGCFASKEVNGVQDGLFFGDGVFFGKQLAAVVFAGVWGFVFTYGMLWIINKIPTFHVRLEKEDQDQIDKIELGEEAYIQEGSGPSTVRPFVPE